MEQKQEKKAGFLLINKPHGMSSFACVKTIRSLVEDKVGHAGTLDTFATGLLILAIGRQATKNISLLVECDKKYDVVAKLGQLTDSLDFTGSVIEKEDITHITFDDVQAAITELGSTYLQIPPIYSALKYRGRPLYYLAQKKQLTHEQLKEITKGKARQVQLHELTLRSVDTPYFSFFAHVSKGTYIRSLANDIARLCGTYATTHELHRTAIGPFVVSDALPLYDLQTRDDVYAHMLSIDDVVQRLAG